MKYANTMKRALSLVLVLLFLTSTLVAAFAASGKESYYVNVKTLKVRSGPSSNYSVVTKLKKNTVVTRYGNKNGWYYVKFSGGSGYVYRKYVSSVKSSSSSTTSSGGYKTTANLRVRASATTNSSVLTKLKKGTKVTLKKQKGSWAYISYSGGKGWVAAKYLKKR